MFANRENELFILSLVDSGQLTVTKSGRVYNNLTNRYIGEEPWNTGYRCIGCRDPSTILKSGRGKVRFVLIHRLVWLVFKNRDLDPDIEINHKDGNKTNCRLSNLEEMTSSENNQHAIDYLGKAISSKGRKALSLANAGERANGAKLKNKTVLKLRKLYRTGKYTQKQLALRCNVSRSSVTRAISGISFKRVSPK